MNVPLARPHPTASGVVESAPLVLVDLETDQGLIGNGYVFCYTPIALKPIADLMQSLLPLIQGDVVAPLALTSKLQGRTPIQIGENLWGPNDLTKSLSAGASDFIMLDAMKIGGITGWLRASSQAEAAGLLVSSHLFPELARSC